MKLSLKPAAMILLITFLILSPVGRVQGAVTVVGDTSNHKINFSNQNITFYYWYGPPQAQFLNETAFPGRQVYINPTFAWVDNKQPSILYVMDLLGLREFAEPNSTKNDNAFQRNEALLNGSFSWVGNEKWGVSNFTSSSTVANSNLNLTLLSTPRTQNFTYLSNNTIIKALNYGSDPSNLKFYTYSYSTTQSRTDLFLNLTSWNWNVNNSLSNLALAFGFYALNTTVIQKLGIHLEDYMVPDYNAISPEDLKPRYAPLDPTAFLLAGMNLTASHGATTAGGFYSLTRNETAQFPSVYEHRLNYTLPRNNNTSLPFIKLQFASQNTTLPGYFSFPGFAVGLDSNSNKKDIFNVTTSYISTGNYMRLFLAYPYFGSDQLRHFFSFGVDDKFLPASPPPPVTSVYIVLPDLPAQQALLIGGLAVLSIVVALFSTRAVRKAGLEARK